MDEHSGIDDIKDIMVGVFDIVVEYESGKISQEQALKRALEVIEVLKSLDESVYQEVKLDLINIIKRT
jgi:hypothetical protein